MAVLNTKSYSLLLGARQTRGTTAEISAADDALLREITARHFPEGFIILKSGGGRFDPARKVFVEEDSRQVLVTTTRPALLRPWCNELGAALGQEEFLIVELGAAATFRVER